MTVNWKRQDGISTENFVKVDKIPVGAAAATSKQDILNEQIDGIEEVIFYRINFVAI